MIQGAFLAGGVHDFVMLLASMRNDGKSLSSIAKGEISPIAGFAASCATLFIISYVLAATSVVVVCTAYGPAGSARPRSSA